MREAQVFCVVLGGTERCAMVRDAWICCSSADVREGALVSSRRASTSEYVPSPTEWLVGSVFVPSVVGASGSSRMCASSIEAHRDMDLGTVRRMS